MSSFLILTFTKDKNFWSMAVVVTQLVEHLLLTQEVRGSNPVIRNCYLVSNVYKSSILKTV